MARTFAQVLASMTPEARQEIHQGFLDMLKESGVSFIREARGKSQQDVARQLGCSQANVSKIERQSDMLVSTLRSYIEAAGGTLEIKVSFPGGVISANGIGELIGLPPISVYPMARDVPARQEMRCLGGGVESLYAIAKKGSKAVPIKVISSTVQPTFVERLPEPSEILAAEEAALSDAA